MAANRQAIFAVPVAAALLLWPALWNGFPIVFADTGTYLSQAIHHYAGWDRPVFYSVFMLPLHATVTLWPVVGAQALLAAWVLRLVCRALVPGMPGTLFVAGVAVLAACTWLPWVVSELMPDVFTPLLVLVACLLAWVPERCSRREQLALAGFAGFAIASQQSSLPLAFVLLAALVAMRGWAGAGFGGPGFGQGGLRRRACGGSWLGVCWRFAVHGAAAKQVVGGRAKPGHDIIAPPCAGPAHDVGGNNGLAPTREVGQRRRWLLVVMPPVLAVVALCGANLAAHGRFTISPFGNVFLLARVIYDGPGLAAMRRDCPVAHWRMCPFLDELPASSDEFLWDPNSPLNRAGGAKAVAPDAGAIIGAALAIDPAGEARAFVGNALEQLRRFASGDGLNPWPVQVSPSIERDFPASARAAYASALQQQGLLSVPSWLSRIHMIVAVSGVVANFILLAVALSRRSACAGFLFAVLLALPVSAAITGGLSTPHNRYQSRLMWLPPFIAMVSLASLRRRPA